MPNTPLKYVARLSHVREVALLGAADLDFWKHKLRDENLSLAEKDGRAQILITAADSKFFGVRFREVSVSVLIDSCQGVPIEGAYLAQAFNSFRFFAFCERNLFATPYDHAGVRVECCPPSVKVTKGGQVLFRAEMAADGSAVSRAPTRHAEEGWEGPVCLPRVKRRGGRDGKWFFAKIHGDTRAYPFLPSEDLLLLRPSPGSEVIQALIDSRFACTEWAVREDATHAKSKTYAGTEPLAELARK
jgi:hypothetical protein